MIGLALSLATRRSISPLVMDVFGRADSAAGLGTAASGQAWAAVAGTLGITGGRGYVAAGNGFVAATIQSGAGDIEVECDYTWRAGESGGLFIRAVAGATANRIGLTIASNALNLVRTVAGANTTIGSFAMVPVDGTTYRLRLRARGTSLIAYIDGVQRIAVADGAGQANTACGLEAFRSGAVAQCRWDNLSVRRI